MFAGNGGGATYYNQGAITGPPQPGNGALAFMRHKPQPPRFDGKRIRKAIQRKPVEYYVSVARHVTEKKRFAYRQDESILQPESDYSLHMLPPPEYERNPLSGVCTRFAHTAVNKERCQINVVRWTPEGRRLITGTYKGEFTLWNGLTLNFQTIMQTHDESIRSMMWSHNEQWMISSDKKGIIKYWKPNMCEMQEIKAHQEACRDLAFSPNDAKFGSCSDDKTAKIYDFSTRTAEFIFKGHSDSVKSFDWHPSYGFVGTCGKDNAIKLWDPRSGKELANIVSHKNSVLRFRFNKNGRWFVTTGRDNTAKVFDVRMQRELHTYKGFSKEATAIAWHPHHEGLFATGTKDGNIHYWLVGEESHVAMVSQAHEGAIWSMDFHPLGHILATGSNDNHTRLWTRHRPGDTIVDKFNGGTNATAAALAAAAAASGTVLSKNDQYDGPMDSCQFNRNETDVMVTDTGRRGTTRNIFDIGFLTNGSLLGSLQKSALQSFRPNENILPGFGKGSVRMDIQEQVKHDEIDQEDDFFDDEEMENEIINQDKMEIDSSITVKRNVLPGLG